MYANQKFYLLLLPACFFYLLSFSSTVISEVVDRVEVERQAELVRHHERPGAGSGPLRQAVDVVRRGEGAPQAAPSPQLVQQHPGGCRRRIQALDQAYEKEANPAAKDAASQYSK